jgi:hypothetical protein
MRKYQEKKRDQEDKKRDFSNMLQLDLVSFQFWMDTRKLPTFLDWMSINSICKKEMDGMSIR